MSIAKAPGYPRSSAMIGGKLFDFGFSALISVIRVNQW
jgi:hypothetical protein